MTTNNKNNKYIFTNQNNQNKSEDKFFKNEDKLIVFALNDKVISPEILNSNQELLNPHHKVNSWIENNKV